MLLIVNVGCKEFLRKCHDSATLRKILAYLLLWTLLLMLVYLAVFNLIIDMMIGFTAMFRFPIPGRTSDMGEYFPLGEDVRVILSLICYQFMLAIFATIPLYKTKRFEDTQFYSAYKIFWWFNAPIFSMILTMLVGAVGALSSYSTIWYILSLIFCVIWIAIPSAIVLMLTLIPAYLQHKNKHHEPKINA